MSENKSVEVHEKMTSAISLKLSLSEVVIRALRLSFAVLGYANEYHGKNLHLPGTEMSGSSSFLSELGVLYKELALSKSLPNTQDGSSKTLLEVATKMQRVVSDLLVHLEESQQVEGRYKQSSELRPRLQRIWTKEDREALDCRLSGLKDTLIKEVVSALK